MIELLVLQQHDVVGLQVAVDERRRLVCMCVQHVADALAPLDDQRQRERLVAVGLHQVEQVLAADELHDQVGGLALLDEVVNARHDRAPFERAQDLGLAAEEVEADGELLRVVADHVLDGDRRDCSCLVSSAM